MLYGQWFAVAVAESGEAALRLMDSGLDFDLLLVDFAMPGMNGLELARQVPCGVGHRSRWCSLPAVMSNQSAASDGC